MENLIKDVSKETIIKNIERYLSMRANFNRNNAHTLDYNFGASLSLAISYKKIEAAQHLLSRIGINIDVNHDFDETKSTFGYFINSLLEEFIEKELSNYGNSKELIKAVNTDKKNWAKYLFGYGTYVSPRDEAGNTPLILATLKGNREMVEIIVNEINTHYSHETSKHLNIKNNFNRTALEYATDHIENENYAEIIRLLLSQDNIEITDINSLFESASALNRTAITDLLKKRMQDGAIESLQNLNTDRQLGL